MAVKSNFRAGRDGGALTENVELLTGQRGDGLDRAITLRELNALGLATLSRIGGIYTSKNGTVPGSSTPGVVDHPSKPLNVLVNGAFNTILIQWDEPNYRGHAYTEVWRAETNNLAVAVMIGTSAARMYADPIGGDAHVYYWVRFVNKNGVPGPYNSTAGTYGETAVNVGQLLDALTGQIADSQLTQTLLTKVNKINLIGKFRVVSSGYGGGSSSVTNSLSGAAVASGGRSWNLVVLNKANYDVLFTGTYDVFGNATYAQTLADKLNSYTAGTVLAIIYTLDEPQTNLTTALKTALKSYGASTSALDRMAYRGAYILAGVPGIGEGNGEEYIKTVEAGHIETTINFTNGNLDGQASASYAVVRNEVAARTTADSALATDISTVQTSLNGTNATVSTLSSSVSYMDANGSAAYRAMWAVKAQVGNITAGIGLMVSNGVSQVMVSASQFFVFDPNGTAPTQALLAVSNGAVVIRKALIESATIETVQAMTLTADYVVSGIRVTSPVIVGGSLSLGGGSNMSFQEGGSAGFGKGGPYGGWGYGWNTIIYADGGIYTNRLYASGGTFTGTVNANAGTFNNVTINENCDVKGTIYANKLVGDVVALKPFNLSFPSTKVNEGTTVTLFSFNLTPSSRDRYIRLTGTRCPNGGNGILMQVVVSGVQVASAYDSVDGLHLVRAGATEILIRAYHKGGGADHAYVAASFSGDAMVYPVQSGTFV